MVEMGKLSRRTEGKKRALFYFTLFNLFFALYFLPEVQVSLCGLNSSWSKESLSSRFVTTRHQFISKASQTLFTETKWLQQVQSFLDFISLKFNEEEQYFSSRQQRKVLCISLALIVM